MDIEIRLPNVQSQKIDNKNDGMRCSCKNEEVYTREAEIYLFLASKSPPLSLYCIRLMISISAVKLL